MCKELKYQDLSPHSRNSKKETEPGSGRPAVGGHMCRLTRLSKDPCSGRLHGWFFWSTPCTAQRWFKGTGQWGLPVFTAPQREPLGTCWVFSPAKCVAVAVWPGFLHPARAGSHTSPRRDTSAFSDPVTTLHYLPFHGDFQNLLSRCHK